MKKRVGQDLIDTNRYILTFNRTELPRLIKITDWHHEIVNLYIPPPLKCMKCQRFGHLKKWCRREEEICAKCGDAGHTSRSCQNETSCVNCNGDHSAMDRQCPVYILRSEIVATHVRQRIPIQEDVKERYRTEGRPYSFAVRRQRVRPSQAAARTENANPTQTSNASNSKLPITEPVSTATPTPQEPATSNSSTNSSTEIIVETASSTVDKSTKPKPKPSKSQVPQTDSQIKVPKAAPSSKDGQKRNSSRTRSPKTTDNVDRSRRNSISSSLPAQKRDTTRTDDNKRRRNDSASPNSRSQVKKPTVKTSNQHIPVLGQSHNLWPPGQHWK